MVTDYVECQCSDFNHVIRFNMSELDGDVYVDVRLNHYEPWYKRAWIALKYVFKQPHAYGHYDVTLLRSEDYQKLHDLLDLSSKLQKTVRLSDNTVKSALEQPTEKLVLKG